MSALAIPEGLEPLADFDPREWPCRYSDGEMQQIVWWMQKHLTEYARYADRVEIYMLDAPFAVVHRYARDGDGFKYALEPGGPPATDEPVIVPLTELPPEHLLRA